jgi:outer membrane protein TolC
MKKKSSVKLHFWILIIFQFVIEQTLAQNIQLNKQKIHLTLAEAVRLATDSSLSAFRSQNTYLAGYWAYRTFLANRLPSVSVHSDLFDFSRALVRRYDYLENIDVYRQQQSLNSTLNLSVYQNIGLTGGQLFVDTELGRLQNYGESRFTQFSSVPIRIGYRQNLFGFNSYKWDKKIEPLKFEKAKKEFVKNYQEIAGTVVEYFFYLASSQLNYETARINSANADTLFAIGQKRFEIATITEAELMTLKVEKLNSINTLSTAQKELDRARFYLNSYLNFDELMAIELSLPELLPEIRIDPVEALKLALENNPQPVQNKQQIIEARRDVEQVKRLSRFNATVNASFGLNQQDSLFSNSYRNPMDQEIISVGVTIPIIDWGLAKGKINMAEKNMENILATAKQAEIDFRQEVIMAVADFNMQKAIVQSASESQQIAMNAYQIYKQRFMQGKVDMNTLYSSLNRQDQAKVAYINSLKNYWKYYYIIRKLTLYDFIERKSLLNINDKLYFMER